MRVQNKFKDDPAIASRYLADQLSGARSVRSSKRTCLRNPEVARGARSYGAAEGRPGEAARFRRAAEARAVRSLSSSGPTFLAAAAIVAAAAIGLMFVRTALMAEPPRCWLRPLARSSMNPAEQLRRRRTHALERLPRRNYDLQISSTRFERQAIEAAASARRPLVALTHDTTSLCRSSRMGAATEPVAALKDLRPAPDRYISVLRTRRCSSRGGIAGRDGSTAASRRITDEIFLIRVRPPGAAER